MVTRIISALIAAIVFIPLLIIGGNVFDGAVIIVALLGLKEFIDIKCTKKEMPIFIKLMSYIIMTIILLSSLGQKDLTFSLDYRVLSLLFITFLLPTVLYREKEKYSINDAFYLIGGILFLGISMSLIMLIRNTSLCLTIYLFLITIVTDTYAYFTGMLIGKHKLIERISPKKTWEGSIGGTFFGVLISSVFYHFLVSQVTQVPVVILVTLILSILGQFGDLVFSCIKRYFGKKDFSNIMPGHGGVLDRLDSIIFVLLGFIFFMTIL